MEGDVRKLGVKRWRTKALEREEWASIIKKAKVQLKGRSAIGRRMEGKYVFCEVRTTTLYLMQISFLSPQG